MAIPTSIGTGFHADDLEITDMQKAVLQLLAAYTSSILKVAFGGTGLASYAIGDLLYASGAAALSKLAVGAADTYVRSDGTNPTWFASPMLGATTAAGQSITNTGAAVIVVFGTVERDTDSGYNSGTGRYTIPTGKGGDYEVSGTVAWSAAATGAFVQVFKNAALLKTLAYVGTGATGIGTVQGNSTTVTLAASDVIDIRVGHTSAAAVTLAANADRNFFAVRRLG